MPHFGAILAERWPVEKPWDPITLRAVAILEAETAAREAARMTREQAFAAAYARVLEGRIRNKGTVKVYRPVTKYRLGARAAGR